MNESKLINAFLRLMEQHATTRVVKEDDDDSAAAFYNNERNKGRTGPNQFNLFGNKPAAPAAKPAAPKAAAPKPAAPKPAAPSVSSIPKTNIPNYGSMKAPPGEAQGGYDAQKAAAAASVSSVPKTNIPNYGSMKAPPGEAQGGYDAQKAAANDTYKPAIIRSPRQLGQDWSDRASPPGEPVPLQRPLTRPSVPTSAPTPPSEVANDPTGVNGIQSIDSKGTAAKSVAPSLNKSPYGSLPKSIGSDSVESDPETGIMKRTTPTMPNLVPPGKETDPETGLTKTSSEEESGGKTKRKKSMKESTLIDAALSLIGKENMFESAKKAKKDWDGDGKIESEKDEVWGSRFKAAKKAGKMEEVEQVDESDFQWHNSKDHKPLSHWPKVHAAVAADVSDSGGGGTDAEKKEIGKTPIHPDHHAAHDEAEANFKNRKLMRKARDLHYSHDVSRGLHEEVEQVDEKVKTTYENPLVTVHDKHGLHTHANLSTANKIFNTKVKHTDVHAGPVKTKDGHETKNDLKFAISKHHASQVDEAATSSDPDFAAPRPGGEKKKGEVEFKPTEPPKDVTPQPKNPPVPPKRPDDMKENVEFSEAELAHLASIIEADAAAYAPTDANKNYKVNAKGSERGTGPTAGDLTDETVIDEARGRPKGSKKDDVNPNTQNGRDPRQHIQVIAGQAMGGRVMDFKHDNGQVSKITPPMGRRIVNHLGDLKPAEKQKAVIKMHHHPEGLKV